MEVVAWIALGAVVGLVADMLTGRRTALPIAALIGVAGAVVGGLVARVTPGAPTASTLITAAVSAAIFYFLLASFGHRAPARNDVRRRTH